MKEACFNCMDLLKWNEENPKRCPLGKLEVILDAISGVPSCKNKTCMPLVKVRELIKERKGFCEIPQDCSNH